MIEQNVNRCDFNAGYYVWKACTLAVFGVILVGTGIFSIDNILSLQGAG